MSFLLLSWWNRLGWEQIDTWQHPQTNSSCYRSKLPYFCGHVPQESGTRAGGSLSENWPKRPRHADKTTHRIQLRLLILYLWNWCTRSSMEGIETSVWVRKCWFTELVQLFWVEFFLLQVELLLLITLRNCRDL